MYASAVERVALLSADIFDMDALEAESATEGPLQRRLKSETETVRELVVKPKASDEAAVGPPEEPVSEPAFKPKVSDEAAMEPAGAKNGRRHHQKALTRATAKTWIPQAKLPSGVMTTRRASRTVALGCNVRL